ncbi:hypothetical protein [Paraburkholderia sediminicola]|uniref:hypothetical protein n=1 Tax=Paraburkholderia sediminicola TaxID=458836 RepID=UPI0038BC3B29
MSAVLRVAVCPCGPAIEGWAVNQSLILKIHVYPLFGACYASVEMCAWEGEEMGAGLEHLRFQPALAPVFRDIRGRPVEAIKRNGEMSVRRIVF